MPRRREARRRRSGRPGGAVDVLFEDLAEANAGRSSEEKANIETRFVRRTGMLPAALSDSLIGGMLSEDPAAQVAAAGRIVRLEDIEPTVGDEIPGDTLTSARTINAFAYPGLPPARIVLLAEERVAREAKETAQAEDIDDEDYTPDLLDRLRELLFGGPAAALSWTSST